jgi:putative phosphoribosyl transferase
MHRSVFHDRRSAGELLGIEVANLELDMPVVLGLPRGGVPVAAKVAAAIHAPLDVIVVRKLGVPDQPELAMGAIGENGVIIVNDEVLGATRVDESEFAHVERRERAELHRSLSSIRAVRPHQSLLGCTAIIVDDGIATGATARAAIEVATPVAPEDVVEALRASADDVVCLAQPAPFGSVGRWYHRFEAVSQAEVLELLSSAIERERGG